MKRTRARGERILLSDKCRAIKILDDGSTLICWRSPGHTNATRPDRREHFDPSADKYWTD